MNFFVNKLTKTILILIFFSKNTYSQSSRLIQEELINPTKIESARLFYNKGTNFISQGKYPNAIEELKSAINIDTNFIDAYDNIALAFRRNNMLDSAEFYYKISMKKYPKGVAPLMGLGVVYSLKGDFSKAENYYKLLIELEPKNPEGYYGLTKTYLDWNKFEKALENSFIAERLYVENKSQKEIIGDCYNLRSYIFYNLNNYSDAKKCIEKAKEFGVKVNTNFYNAIISH